MVLMTEMGGRVDGAQEIKKVDDSIKLMMDLGVWIHASEEKKRLHPEVLKIIDDLKEFRSKLVGAEVWTTNDEDDDAAQLQELLIDEDFLEEADANSMLEAFRQYGISMSEDLQSFNAEQMDLNFSANLDPDVVTDMGEAAVIILRPGPCQDSQETEELDDEIVDLYEEVVVGSPAGQVVPASPEVPFGSPSWELHEEEEQHQPPESLQRKPRGKDYKLVEGQVERMRTENRRQRQQKTSESDQEPEPSCALPFLMRKTLGHNCKRLPLPGDKNKRPKAEKSQQVNATVYFLRPRKVAETVEQDQGKKKDEPVASTSKGLMASIKEKKTLAVAKNTTKKNKKAEKVAFQPAPESETDDDFVFNQGSDLSRRSQKLLKKLKPCNVKVLNLNFNIHESHEGTATGVKSQGKVSDTPSCNDEDLRGEDAEVVGTNAEDESDVEESMDVRDDSANAESNDDYGDQSDSDGRSSGSSDSETYGLMQKSKAFRRRLRSSKLPVKKDDSETYRVFSTRAGCRYSLRKLKRTTRTAGGVVMYSTTTTPERELETTRRMTRASAAKLDDHVQDQLPLTRPRQPKVSKSTLAPPKGRHLTVRESTEKDCILNIMKTVASICNLKNLPEEVPENRHSIKSSLRSAIPEKRSCSPFLSLRSGNLLKRSGYGRDSGSLKKKYSIGQYAMSSADRICDSDSDW